MPGDLGDLEHLMRAALGGIEDMDHKVVVVDAGKGLSEEMTALMEADGYAFYCSPAAKDGKREIYFVRERPPAPRM